MGAEAFLFLHVLAATALLGALLAVALLATAGARQASRARRASVLVAASALATVSFGEAVRAREDASGTWLDVGTLLGYAGLLLPSLVLVVLAGRATGGRLAAGLAWVMVVVALAAVFVMAAKPF